ncbi:hypothetical protein [Stenotrophomonas humi]|uniref:hypothetical protein n=1 Tax=Stenotrophomonas humi TaxID=405444 RepID=UPI00128FC285|nr:hypothetical protein [Stenotrophomonas humi]
MKSLAHETTEEPRAGHHPGPTLMPFCGKQDRPIFFVELHVSWTPPGTSIGAGGTWNLDEGAKKSPHFRGFLLNPELALMPCDQVIGVAHPNQILDANACAHTQIPDRRKLDINVFHLMSHISSTKRFRSLFPASFR